jgi:hypothetical protein
MEASFPKLQAAVSNKVMAMAARDPQLRTLARRRRRTLDALPFPDAALFISTCRWAVVVRNGREIHCQECRGHRRQLR